MSEPNGENNPIYIFFLVTPKMEILENVKTYKKFQKCENGSAVRAPSKSVEISTIARPNLRFGQGADSADT